MEGNRGVTRLFLEDTNGPHATFCPPREHSGCSSCRNGVLARVDHHCSVIIAAKSLGYYKDQSICQQNRRESRSRFSKVLDWGSSRARLDQGSKFEPIAVSAV